MKISITKEEIELMLGYEIEDFNLEPLYVNNKCIGLNVNVQPKSFTQFITVDFKISPTSGSTENLL